MKSYFDIKESIYLIENIINNKKYVGQTLLLPNRIYGHYKELIRNKHNKRLQKDYEEYGLNNFEFKVLEIINTDRIENKKLVSNYMHHRENYYIDKFNTIIEGYNTNRADKIDYSKVDANKNDYYMPCSLKPANVKEFIDLQLDIQDLSKMYFLYNPQYNRGMSFKIKATDTIANYMANHGMTYDDVKKCIEISPMCKFPVWTQFYNYWYKEDMRNKNKKKEVKKENSHYKNSIQNSTNIDDWM
jgi:group I intron endonuclease